MTHTHHTQHKEILSSSYNRLLIFDNVYTICYYGTMRDKLSRAVAKILPKRVKLNCAIFVLTYATTGKYRNTVVPEIPALEALMRYQKDLLD